MRVLFVMLTKYNKVNLFIIVTTYLSFCAKRRIKEPDEKIWQDYFLKVRHKIVSIDNLLSLKVFFNRMLTDIHWIVTILKV